MKRVLLLLIISFSNISYACQEGAILEGSKNHAVAFENADHAGYCNLHASRDLLAQATCQAVHDQKSDPTNCINPAVLDFLNIDAISDKMYRNSDYALSILLEKGSVSLEKCLSMSHLFNDTKGRNYKTYQQKHMEVTLPVMSHECALQELEKNANFIFNEDQNICRVETGLPLPKKELDMILASYKLVCHEKLKKSAEQYLYAAYVRTKKKLTCPTQSIPPFTQNKIEYALISEKMSQAQQSTVYQKRASRLNSILAKGDFRKKSKKGKHVKIITKGPHAYVVTNYRKVCQNGKAVLQYQVVDSLYGTRWSKAKKSLDWIDGNALIRSLSNNPGDTFDWLELNGR